MLYNTETHNDNGGNGKFFVNTLVDGEWSRAALMTNDTPDPLPSGERIFQSGANYEIIPGVSSDGRPSAVGTWLWWLRDANISTDSSDELYMIQGRRVFGLDMPAE